MPKLLMGVLWWLAKDMERGVLTEQTKYTHLQSIGKRRWYNRLNEFKRIYDEGLMWADLEYHKKYNVEWYTKAKKEPEYLDWIIS